MNSSARFWRGHRGHGMPGPNRTGGVWAFGDLLGWEMGDWGMGAAVPTPIPQRISIPSPSMGACPAKREVGWGHTSREDSSYDHNLRSLVHRRTRPHADPARRQPR